MDDLFIAQARTLLFALAERLDSPADYPHEERQRDAATLRNMTARLQNVAQVSTQDYVTRTHVRGIIKR